MNSVFVTASSIVSPLGLSAGETFRALAEGQSGLRPTNHDFLETQTYTSVFSSSQWHRIEEKTKNYRLQFSFEKLLLMPVLDVLEQTGIDVTDKGIILVIATTKGCIDEIENPGFEDHLHLHHSAKKIAKMLGLANTPVVISNACISGLSAIITAQRLLQSGSYHTAIVAGADVLGKFILSGFNALCALSPEPCRPFDAERQGINLGEGSAAIMLQTKKAENCIEILGGSVTNDANHVSAPSRTGNELATAIQRALKESGKNVEDLQFVSAHGTATLYNDEMEAKALNNAGVSYLPTNSLKGYFGHTLGAAGLIESVVCFQSLLHKTFIPGTGFAQQGTSVPVNISTSKSPITEGCALKTMAGFGGCNAALVFSSLT